MDHKLTQEPDGRLLLWIKNVPGFDLKPNETLIECLERTIEDFYQQADVPMRGADPWAKKYARTLEWFLASIKKTGK